eukprot:CAMPEP_0119306302 /NCGR_PEP_ID=MMETSP1333-20130426/7086_1 /TAXON_ID=418940 /ORGANISM="Scyphosphaera apsteinii, Strain RCC1455" /LENGTH=57 /DNA_ID=CAMNT_0007309565 /DNA_START=113 /DNA_END=286 /DNA_ORIENTATION=+
MGGAGDFQWPGGEEFSGCWVDDSSFEHEHGGCEMPHQMLLVPRSPSTLARVHQRMNA